MLPSQSPGLAAAQPLSLSKTLDAESMGNLCHARHIRCQRVAFNGAVSTTRISYHYPPPDISKCFRDVSFPFLQIPLLDLYVLGGETSGKEGEGGGVDYNGPRRADSAPLGYLPTAITSGVIGRV